MLILIGAAVGAFQLIDAVNNPTRDNVKLKVLYTDFNQKQILAADGVVYNYYEGDDVPYITQNYNFQNIRSNNTYNCQIETIRHVWVSDIIGANMVPHINNCIEVKS
jgi:hypothetical protein